MPDTQKPPRKTGVAHFLAAAGYSRAGIMRLLQESAFRQESLAAGAMALALWVFGAAFGHWLVFAGLVLLVVALEAINTALEVLVDHLTADWAAFARDAKDLGSLAVMCGLLCHPLLLAHVIFG